MGARQMRREQNYFAQHAARMNYRELSRNGPLGSGAVESACRQRQGRFKRAGQFWSDEGMKHLCALQKARRHGHAKNYGPPPTNHDEKRRPRLRKLLRSPDLLNPLRVRRPVLHPPLRSYQATPLAPGKSCSRSSQWDRSK